MLFKSSATFIGLFAFSTVFCASGIHGIPTNNNDPATSSGETISNDKPDPEPINRAYNFASKDTESLLNDEWSIKTLDDGRRSSASASSQEKQVEIGDGSLVVGLSQQKDKVLLKNKNAIKYGKISARVKTADVPGVLTAFVLAPEDDTEADSIDFEWIGKVRAGQQSQQDRPVLYKEIEIPQDKLDNFHNYEIEWNSDSVKILFDGETVQEFKEQDQNASSIKLPSAPMKMSMGVFAPKDRNTQQWAGGAVPWDKINRVDTQVEYVNIVAGDKGFRNGGVFDAAGRRNFGLLGVALVSAFWFLAGL